MMLIASDGLWDAVSTAEIVDICTTSFDKLVSTKQVADLLVNVALQRNQHDNITCMLIRLE
jgi:serine/threonine protein phosphatase PrpC